MGCSCGSSGRQTFSQIVAQDGSSLPTLKYIHCRHKDQFELLFSQVGITANESNLKLLAIASDTGADKRGEIKDKSGKPIYFSVEDIVAKIDKSRVTNNICSI